VNLTHEERIELQKTLDAVYAVECDAYEDAIARGVPEWLLKKPERIILMNQPSVFRAPHGANIKPHYGVKS